MNADEPLTDEQRFPLLGEPGRAMLRRLLEHPAAPRYNNRAGDRLTADGLAAVRRFAERVRSQRPSWQPAELPPWVKELMDFCRREVPFHRRRLDWSDDFFNLPSLERASLHREPWSFVPDSVDVNDLVVYTTSGTMGDRLKIPSHPEVAGHYLPLLEMALAAYSVRLEGGPRVAIIQVHSQVRTYSFASVVSYLDFAGYAKINLNPTDWRDPGDRVRFLDDCNPEIYTGDPFAFTELMKLPLTSRPKALVSSATTLLPGLRKQLEAHFRCPVVDIYSLNEAGPVAFAHGGGFEILPPDLYVEILDPDDRVCPPGVRGEIVLTGGHNPYLPLLRYRSGDHAALNFSGPVPRLLGFEGRLPTLFRAAGGAVVNSIDVSTVLRDLPLPFFTLKQTTDGALRFRTSCDEPTRGIIEQRLHDLFGASQPLAIEVIPASTPWSGKPIQYASELAE